MQEFIYKLVNRQDLSAAEMTRAMETIMTGEATDAQIGAFVTAIADEGGDGDGDRRRGPGHARQGHPHTGVRPAH